MADDDFDFHPFGGHGTSPVCGDEACHDRPRLARIYIVHHKQTTFVRARHRHESSLPEYWHRTPQSAWAAYTRGAPLLTIVDYIIIGGIVGAEVDGRGAPIIDIDWSDTHEATDSASACGC